MDQRLKVAAEAGDINALYALFREYPNVLKDIDEIPFVDTPLHVAASIGHTHFAVEMISLMPSFGRKLNPDGLSPLHLALQNGCDETVRRLINIDSELIRVQGKERITPLHYVAAEQKKYHLLAEFLCACPESVHDLTVRGETAVHIAVRNCSLDAFEVLLGWADMTGNQMVLRWKDEDGNTALHIAAFTNQPKVVKKLIEHVKRILNDKNLQGLTALDLSESNREIRNMLMGAGVTGCTNAWILDSTKAPLAEFMKKKPISKFLNMKRISDDMRNVVLVVATLVATATYQVAANPPDGLFEQDNKDDTHSVQKLAVPVFFYWALLFINSTAFAASVGVLFLSLQNTFHFLLLRLTLTFLIFSYVLSVVLTTPKNVVSYIAISTPFVFFVWGTCWRIYHFWLEVCIFTKMSIGMYNPSRFFEMRNQMVGLYTYPN